jgi:hypothetical protein
MRTRQSDDDDRMKRLRDGVQKYESLIAELDAVTRQLARDARSERDSRDISDDGFDVIEQFADYWDGSLSEDLGDWARNVVELVDQCQKLKG